MHGRAFSVSLFVALAFAACGGDDGGKSDGDGGLDAALEIDACVGLGCQQVSCMGGGTTSISGTVYAPNGTLPLYNATVYVPLSAVGPLVEGAQCDRCGATLQGNPLVQTVTDTEGRFTLDNMPVGADIPVVIQIGKWRRQIVIPQVASCVDSPLAASVTRLPKNKSEGDIPLMALTTGGADSLECLLRKIGLDDAEFTAAGGDGRVNLFTGSGGTPRFAATLNGGAAFTNATTLWDTVEHLRAYDVVFMSCEGGQNPGTKGVTALQAMSDYSDLGGRVFMSHWHNYWVQNGPGEIASVAQFDFQNDIGDVTADVNTSFARGPDFADWLLNVGASTTLGKVAITDSQHTINSIDPVKADSWISVPAAQAGGNPSIQFLQFTTPLTEEPTNRCGKQVVSDIHVSTGDDSADNIRFPNGCTTTGLTPQEKILAFMIFDIASCVGPPIGKVAAH